VSNRTSESFLDGRVTIVLGDITRQDTDAIVNAANSTLLGGGGVDGAIHDAAGPSILEECRVIRGAHYPKGLPAGEAVITGAGRLKAQFVIHTVGPIYGRHGGNEARLLASCYRKSLELAREHQLISIAFPAISTGAFGYPRMEAAEISSKAIKQFLEHDTSVKSVRMVFILASDARNFLAGQKFH
jgi:O-acetyl-ADP-ribose deacetylase (regulator of RNase III)